MVTRFLNFPNGIAVDISGLQLKSIKYVIALIAPVLTYIFNLISATNAFPTYIQTGEITIIPKGGAT